MKHILPLLLLFLAQRAAAQSQQPLTQQLDSLIATDFKPSDPGGVVLLAQKGTVIYKKAFGQANLELQVPMRTSAVFNIGSITKQFTAIAILQLAEQGRLSLQDELIQYLPDYPVNGNKITIEHLLTHTAGIPNAKDVSAIRPVEKGQLTPQEVMATFKALPLEFLPGTKMAYSNSGYQLLGYIIEKVSGMPYPAYLEKYLFAPAGLTDTHFGNDFKIVPNRVGSYMYLRGQGIYENAHNGNINVPYSAGSLQSTADDLLKWNQALVQGKLVKPETLRKAWSAYRLVSGKETDYGYGWFIGAMGGAPLVEHGGNMGGFMSHAIYFLQEDLYVAVLFNFRGRLPETLASDLAALALGRPTRKEIPVKPEVLQAYTGMYEDADSVKRTIFIEEGKLVYQRVGATSRLGMVPYEKDKFFFPNTSIVAQFMRDRKNRITALHLFNIRRSDPTVLKRTAH